MVMATSPVTVRQHVEQLIPRIRRDGKAPVWPADVFGICATLLIKSGSYCRALTYWPPTRYRRRDDPRYWAGRARSFGQRWRRSWARKGEAPPRVSTLWRKIVDSGRTPLHRVSEELDLCQNILELCAIADEACQGVGNPLDGDESDIDQKFLYHAAGLLHRELPGSSVCDEIHPSRLRVLPKMHTPQSGLTIRSLSLYVCLCPPNEVVPAWIEAMRPLGQDSVNLLVIPWPLEVFPAQFRVAEPMPDEMKNMPDAFGFFTFSHRSPGTTVLDTVKLLYEAARDEVGRVDGVVLPELALTGDEHRDVRDYVLDQDSFLVSGVG